MLVDANILLYAVDTESPFHEKAEGWLTTQLNGVRRVALAEPRRVRADQHQPAGVGAAAHVRASLAAFEDWLGCDTVGIPNPTEHLAQVLGHLVTKYELRGNLVSDAAIAALSSSMGSRCARPAPASRDSKRSAGSIP